MHPKRDPSRGLFADWSKFLRTSFDAVQSEILASTRTFVSWAVTGSNRRPLRCKRSALPLS